MNRNAFIRASWGTVPVSKIADMCGVSKQRVSTIARNLGLPKLRPGRARSAGASYECARCHKTIEVEQKRDIRKVCPDCRVNDPVISMGQRAYHLYRMSVDRTWLDVANALRYQEGRDDRARIANIVRIARAYAERNHFKWPIRGA